MSSFVLGADFRTMMLMKKVMKNALCRYLALKHWLIILLVRADFLVRRKWIGLHLFLFQSRPAAGSPRPDRRSLGRPTGASLYASLWCKLELHLKFKCNIMFNLPMALELLQPQRRVSERALTSVGEYAYR